MLVKVLLQKVFEYIEAHPTETGSLIVKIEASYLDLSLEQFLENLDVRHLGTLRALVPGAFPRKLRSGDLDIKLNIHGLWRVDPKS